MKKKLIEVALPLEAISEASSREKAIHHGHPTGLHLWWARRPLASCRAVLFAQLVDDPSSDPGRFPTEEEQTTERHRLFRLMEELVRWENVGNERVWEAAREEIDRSVGGSPPTVVDPFCGGGSIPVEAQRLGLPVQASDLNPVAVLLTKALVEIPPRFAGRAPVAPIGDRLALWSGAEGLAADVDYYGRDLERRLRAELGGLYPPVSGDTKDGPVSDLIPIAWIWARSIVCPNPACGAEMPLVNSWMLSNRPGRRTWAEPAFGPDEVVRFRLRGGDGEPREGTVNRRGAECIVCGHRVPLAEVRERARLHGLGRHLIAVVAEGESGRAYLAPSHIPDESVTDLPEDLLDTSLPAAALGFRVQAYGLEHHRDLFTPRQLRTLKRMAELVADVRSQAIQDALSGGMAPDGIALESGGSGSTAYGDAIAVYLGLFLGRVANRSSNQCFWDAGGQKVQQVFARNALPMIWVSAEANPFSDSSGNILGQLRYLVEALRTAPARPPGLIEQRDARAAAFPSPSCFSTDPPYYDNVPYADLSDFFYVWLRRALGKVLPDLFSTVLVPKSAELIAEPARHSGRADANAFFEKGLRKAFTAMSSAQDSRFPSTIFYAFKQSEAVTVPSGNGGAALTGYTSTGWETMLQGLVDAGMAITGTWPVRTEQAGGLRQLGRNALASSIVLATRPRPVNADMATRRQFVSRLRDELPVALRRLQDGNIAPVDLAQAAIGPGMAIFSEYGRVVEADGSSMRVRTALALINQALSEVLQEQEGDFDPETRWAVAWYEQFGREEGPYGDAELLSKAKNTAVAGLVEAGILTSKGGKVRLLPREEMPSDWSPATDSRMVVWEILQHLVRRLDQEGETRAADLIADVGALADPARELAYRLYGICERKGWSEEGIAYNALVVAWPELARLASAPDSPGGQTTLGLG